MNNFEADLSIRTAFSAYCVTLTGFNINHNFNWLQIIQKSHSFNIKLFLSLLVYPAITKNNIIFFSSVRG